MKRRDGILTFRLPDEEKAKLALFAEQQDRSLSDLAVLAVRDLIAKLDGGMEPPKEEPKAPRKKK
jgi:predicted HicB family RNase H-like nuclease